MRFSLGMGLISGRVSSVFEGLTMFVYKEVDTVYSLAGMQGHGQEMTDLTPVSVCSRIFAPYRQIGKVCNETPFAVEAKGQKEAFVTVSIGKSFQIFNTSKLHLLFVGQDHLEKKIQCLATHRDLTFAGVGTTVRVFRRARQIQVFSGPHTRSICNLLVLGNHLLALGLDGVLSVWDLNCLKNRTNVLLGDIDGLESQVEASPENVWKVYADSSESELVEPTCMIHPDTYLNKVLIGTRCGTGVLLNVQTGKVVHRFDLSASACASNSNSRKRKLKETDSVSCIVQSPAVDVVGVGFESGRILVLNLKFDETLLSFAQSSSRVTSLSFRSDGTSTLCSGSEYGEIFVWDLEKKRLHGTLLPGNAQCHYGSVAHMYFLDQEPVLVSTGSDNAIRMWIFDREDGHGRLLRERSGHRAPPTRVQFYDDEGFSLLSGGLDQSVRVTSMIQDRQNVELSQKNIQSRARKAGVDEETLRLPAVRDMHSVQLREHDWSNIVTVHTGDTHAHTWKYETKSSALKLSVPSKFGRAPLMCCYVTSCGNFCLVGSANGQVHRFNMQSGEHRMLYRGHSGAVFAVAADELNTVVLSGGYDGKLRFWDFASGKESMSIDMGSSVTRIALGPSGSPFVAVVCDNNVVSIYDVNSKQCVRRFVGHSASITDLAFTSDARYLITTSMDCTIRTWSLASGSLVDWFSVERPATSITIHPRDLFFASTHVDAVGIFVWSNRLKFSSAILSPIDSSVSTPPRVFLPSASGEGGASRSRQSQVQAAKAQAAGEDGEDTSDVASVCSVTDESDWIECTDLPKAQWQLLPVLELVRQRNQVKDIVQKKEVPFFLPTELSAESSRAVKFDVNSATPAGGEDDDRKGGLGGLETLLSLRSKLVSMAVSDLERGDDDFSGTFELLKAISPATMEAEFTSLDVNVDPVAVKAFLSFFRWAVASKTHFDFFQASLRLFLKIHGESIAGNKEFRPILESLLVAQQETWHRLRYAMQYSSCLVRYCSHLQ